MRRRVDKLAALRKDQWVDLPAAKWVAWADLAARWAVLPRAKWVAWAALAVRWAVPPKGKWVAWAVHPVGKV